MKHFFASCLIVLSVQSLAGGFTFPNVPYAYARAYLYNIHDESYIHRPDYAIYRDGMYAVTKLGNGWEVSSSMVREMNMIFQQGVDMMVAGLSSCFTPRHGVIYFDQVGKPVASLSICFECQKIYFWSSDPVPEFHEPDVFSKEAKRAEKQFSALEACFERAGIPVYQEVKDYLQFKDTYSDSLFVSEGEVIINDPDHSVFGIPEITREIATSWLRSSGATWVESEREQVDTRQTDGEEMRTFVELRFNKASTLVFSKGENMLGEAYIKSPEVVLPNGATVGMSTDQVQALCGVWDGLAYPRSIIINYSDATLRYTFENRTLWLISLVVY